MPLGLIGEKIIMLYYYVMMSGCVEIITGESEMKMPTKLESACTSKLYYWISVV